MKNIIKTLFLFTIGGLIYCLCELAFRSYTHPSMFFVGGVCFVLIGIINETALTYDMSILLQCLIATSRILVVEFLSGVILNLIIGLHIWDYSNLPFNLFGQICLYFAGAWYVLSAIGIILDDYLRYFIFGEEKPHYKL